jgi:hypothetical protein
MDAGRLGATSSSILLSVSKTLEDLVYITYGFGRPSHGFIINVLGSIN